MDQNYYRILTGDVSDQLANLPDNFFDAVLSDPPYGLSFMGKEWDKGVPSAEVYGKLLRVLKPGAFGLHFGGTRMWHRLAVNIEDAGFELRDTIMWLYGSGFPKSHNISKAIDKVNGEAGHLHKFTAFMRTTGLTAKRINEATGTRMGSHYLTDKAQPAIPTCALWAKLRPLCGEIPAWVDELVARIEAEREVVGSKSGLVGSGFGNVGHGLTSGEIAITAPATTAAKQWDGYGTALKPAVEPALLVQKPLAGTFANNALTHGCGGLNIEGCRVGSEPVAKLISAPARAKGGSILGGSILNTIKGCELGTVAGRFPANLILDEEAGEALDAQSGARSIGDSGGASRFFYCAKVSTKERNAGLDEFEDREWSGDGACVPERANRPFKPAKNSHPTLKPLALTEYLAKLLLVPKRADGQPRRILVPFSGSGSEMIGCLLAGWDEVWGIELNGDYVKIAESRIKHHCPEAAPLDCLDLGDTA